MKSVKINPEYLEYSSKEVQDILRLAESEIPKRTVNVDLSSIKAGDSLPEVSSCCEYNLNGYACMDAVTAYDGHSVHVVAAFASSDKKPQLYYLFIAKVCSAIYSPSTAPEWVKELFLVNQNEKLEEATTFEENNNPMSLLDDSSSDSEE